MKFILLFTRQLCLAVVVSLTVALLWLISQL